MTRFARYTLLPHTLPRLRGSVVCVSSFFAAIKRRLRCPPALVLCSEGENQSGGNDRFLPYYVRSPRDSAVSSFDCNKKLKPSDQMRFD